MLTGKQKSVLRSLGQKLKPVFQVGKEGVTQAVFQSVYDYLFKNELCKINVLDTSPQTIQEVAHEFQRRHIDVAQTIGKTILLFLPNENLEDRIILPE